MDTGAPLLQDELDSAFRSYFEKQPDVGAAVAYGSRPAGLGDEYSDVEYWVFVDDVEPWSAGAWLEGVGVEGMGEGPIFLVENEFGALVAVYDGLVRVEVHVWPHDDVDVVRSWPARDAPVDAMVIVDREGRLADALASLPERPRTPQAPEEIVRLCGRFANWWLLGWNVLGRGELARAQDAMSHVRRHVLWMARVQEGATTRWLTPSRLAEADLSEGILEKYAEAVDFGDLAAGCLSYGKIWELGEKLWRDLTPNVPERLMTEVRSAIDAGHRPR